jgi:dipeptidyl aminopeptidase/acylaminoacyl peptidase
VLDVHGGPWSRVGFGFSAHAQWLANRGYASLSVNFRSSTGFGKSFANAGDGEWGRKMDDDLLDAVAYAIDHKIADPDRVAILGASYGGYATLIGMTRDPSSYACGVDTVGPSDLAQLLRTVPPYWAADRPKLIKALGDPSTPEGLALLKERSPLFQAIRIEKPLMVVQSENDSRVVRAHSDEIVDTLKGHHISVTYVLVKNEGHVFARP